MRIPAQGPLDTLFERLADYIQPDYPEWLGLLKPADANRIEQLRRAAHLPEIGRDFPPAYRMYLERMGADDGGLATEWDEFGIERSVDELIELYESEYTFYEKNGLLAQFDPHWLWFLYHWTDASLYFDLRQGENPPIYYGKERPEYFSQNFEYYLFQRAFYQIQKLLFPASISTGVSKIQMEFLLRQQAGIPDVPGSFQQERPWLTDTPGNSLAFLERLLSPFALQKLWFSDAANYIGVCGDVSVIARGAGAFWILFLGAPYQKAAKIARQIESDLYVEQSLLRHRPH